MSFLRAIFGFTIAIILTAFAVANRQDIILNYSPIHAPLELPLYLIALLFLVIGFIFGTVLMWLNSAPVHRLKRQQRKTIKALEKELSRLKTNSKDDTIVPSSELFPALPSTQKENAALPKV